MKAFRFVRPRTCAEATVTPVRSAIETQIDFTMGFRRDPQGVARMTLHHSSTPFRPIKGAKLAA